MKRIVLFATLVMPALLLATNHLAAQPNAKDGGWTRLFNGKNLDGWRIFLDPRAKADPQKIFSVQDGTIAVEGSVNGYIITEKEYDNYVLKLQWKWGQKIPRGRNSGVLLHVTGADKIWPKAAEAQLMANHAGDFWLIDFKLNVDPQRRDPKISRHYFRLKDKVEKDIGEWNQYEITCKDDTIKLVINGHLVNEGTAAEQCKGRILLQSEGAEIYFRNVMLKQLK